MLPAPVAVYGRGINRFDANSLAVAVFAEYALVNDILRCHGPTDCGHVSKARAG